MNAMDAMEELTTATNERVQELLARKRCKLDKRLKKAHRKKNPYQKLEILMDIRDDLIRNDFIDDDQIMDLIRNEFDYEKKIMDRLLAILEEHPHLAHEKFGFTDESPFWALICYGAKVKSLKEYIHSLKYIHSLNPKAFTIDYERSKSVFHKSIRMLDIQMIDFVVTRFPAVLSIKESSGRLTMLPEDGHLPVTIFFEAFEDRMSEELDVVITLRKMVSLYPASISELLKDALSSSNVERIKLFSSWAMSLGSAGSLALDLSQLGSRNIDAIPHVVGLCKKIAYSIDETDVEIALPLLEAMQESTVLESLTLWINRDPKNHDFYSNFLDALIQPNQLQSLTVCVLPSSLDCRFHPNLSTFKALEANTSLQELHLTYSIDFDLAVLADVLKHHNFTLKSVSIPGIYRDEQIKEEWEISYYVALNRCGRRMAMDPNTSLEQFAGLLCYLDDDNLQQERTDDFPDDDSEGRGMSRELFSIIGRHHMIYELLRLAPALLSRS